MRMMSVAAAIAVACAVSVSAQGRNFAGQWTIDAEKTAAANQGAVAVAASRVAVGGGGGGRGGGGGGRVIAGGGEPTTAVARSAAGGGGGRGGATVGAMTLSLDASGFTVGQGESSTTYRLDGTATVSDVRGGRATSKAAWQGDKLVIQTTTESEAGSSSSTTSWFLEGENLVREIASALPSGETSVRKTYYKKA